MQTDIIESMNITVPAGAALVFQNGGKDKFGIDHFEGRFGRNVAYGHPVMLNKLLIKNQSRTRRSANCRTQCPDLCENLNAE